MKRSPRPTIKPFLSNNRKRLRLKKKSRKLLNIITRNEERRPRKPPRRNVSRMRKRKRCKGSVNSRRKPPIVRPTSTPSEPREPWKKPIEKIVLENSEKPKNKYFHTYFLFLIPFLATNSARVV